MDVARAIDAHVLWKTKLRAAIRNKATLDAGTLSVDNLCALGKWLHGEARDVIASADGHQRLVAQHARFHRAAGAVAAQVNEARFAEASAMLRSGSEFASASAEVIRTIAALKRGVPA